MPVQVGVGGGGGKVAVELGVKVEVGVLDAGCVKVCVGVRKSVAVWVGVKVGLVGVSERVGKGVQVDVVVAEIVMV